MKHRNEDHRGSVSEADWGSLSTPTISDALDQLGVVGGCPGIAPIVPGLRIVGRAFTVRYLPTDVESGSVGDFIEEVDPGQVVVLDNGGRMDCTVWGDILTEVSVTRGIAGTVIDGVCRDVERMREIGYGVYSRGPFMVTGKNRVQAEAINVPVAVSGVRVRPDDWMVGDDNGVVVVPREFEHETLLRARSIADTEQRILEAFRQGTTLRQARAEHGYHGIGKDRQPRIDSKERNVKEYVRLLLERNGLSEKDFDLNALCIQAKRLQEDLERIRRSDAFYRYEPIFSHANSRVPENS